MIRRTLQLLLAIVVAGGLIFSIPLMNWFMRGGNHADKSLQKTEVSLKKIAPPQQKLKQEKATRTPNRAKPTARSVKAGPRFAMDLGVIGPGNSGATVDASLVKASSGGGSGASGDVDERPEAESSPSFQAPAAIRDAEIDATVRLQFCVDASGQVYDLKVIEERPAGMGLADAGRAALQKVRFTPAKKDGNSVAFCGLEQPFEIRFRD